MGDEGGVVPEPIPEEPNGFLLASPRMLPPGARRTDWFADAEKIAREIQAELAEARRGMRFLRPDGSIGP